MQTIIGKHIILEFYNCSIEPLDDHQLLQRIFRAAAVQMGATVLSSNFHPFSPIGVSGVVIIKESHLTVHTWPEHQYAAIDIFTCGDIDVATGIAYLKKQLAPKRTVQQVLERGKEILLSNPVQ
ncbi:MAG: adenosylmethionine decarboxylase [Bacteroidota bacterium]